MLYILVIIFISSALLAGSLFRHQRWLTLLATTGTFMEGQWLLSTAISSAVTPHVTTVIFTTVALIILGFSLLQIRSWHAPAFNRATLLGDGSIVVVTTIILGAAFITMSANSFERNNWYTHGFLNGDTVVLAALTQRAIIDPTVPLTNPFAGNGPLEYPTLLHRSLATLLSFAGLDLDWLHYLPTMTYVQILFTIPLFFLLIDTVVPTPLNTFRRHSIPAGLVIFIAAVSWDNYIYPQSHFFLTGLYVLLGALLIKTAGQSGRSQVPTLLPATLIAIVLTLSNAVTGTAAVTAVSMLYLIRLFDTTRSRTERMVFLVPLIVILSIYKIFLPGAPSFGLPSFSYTAALDILRLAPPVTLLLIAVWLGRYAGSYLRAVTVGLCALAFFTFFFSTRDIIIDNASRFFYHAMLIAFPLIIPLTIRLLYVVRRELRFSSHTVPEWFTLTGIAIACTLFLLFPALASIASSHDHLMFKDKHIISPAEQEALQWIRANTKPSAVVLASLIPPWSVPLFTGRALLGADYWLSPENIVRQDVAAAFAGDKAAQEQVARHADYLMLKGSERESWEPLPLPPAFDNETVAIYKIP